MRVLAIGDVCSNVGVREVYKKLPSLKRNLKIDAVIINGENSAETNGVSRESAEFLFNCGADVITGGNHSFRRKDICDYLDRNPFLLRPHNLPDAEFGSGFCIVDFGSFKMAVINLVGKIYLDNLKAENPFSAADELIKKAENEGVNIILVDFHAEATSEKRAMGLYLDGKVSAVFGTHTHVQTADEQILENGTGYITDLGMTGCIDSVLGVKKEIIINRLKSGDPSKFEFAEGEGMLCGCVFEIDKQSGKTLKIERIKV